MDEKKFPLNAIPSSVDPRDYKAQDVVATAFKIPVEFKLDLTGIEIKNQGIIGSCVAHSLAYCREITEKQQSGQAKKFSVGFIYGNREPSDFQQEGMSPRQALKCLQKSGDVLHDEFPYNDLYTVVKAKIEQQKDKLLQKAHPYRISSYYSVNPGDLRELKIAIMQIGPVSAMFPVYESFYSKKLNNIVPIPDTDENMHGYHEMTLIGWDRYGHWIALNSWGENWGDKGLCYIPFIFPILEAWVITDTIFPNKDKKLDYVVVFNTPFATEGKVKTGVEGMKSFVTEAIKSNLREFENNGKYYIEMGRKDTKEAAQELICYIDENSQLKKDYFEIIPSYSNLVNKVKVVTVTQYTKDTAELYAGLFQKNLVDKVKSIGLSIVIKIYDRENGKFSLSFGEFISTEAANIFINTLVNNNIIGKSLLEIV